MPAASSNEGIDADRIEQLANTIGLDIVARAELPARSPVFRAPPAALHRSVREELASWLPDGIYAHQAEGIEAAITGRDLCLSTSTASGKSLVFMTAAAHLLAGDPNARVLALYPARALILDQIEKWQRQLEPFGLRTGLIDGGVPTAQRPAILESSHVVLMTPDVAHAWLLFRLNQREIGEFLGRVRLLVLDEAHVYEGVFGTNMAYFMRRLNTAASDFRLIATTATLGEPGEFIERLTGRQVHTIDASGDASPAPARTVLLANGIKKRSFQLKANLLKAAAQEGVGRFLAFGDSRRLVERMVVTALRREQDESADEDGEESMSRPSEIAAGEILPYRAGYETEDRNAIQTALTRGTLAGVVSTSALELGLDIGDIDLVVLLNPPGSAKSFWQRLGRTRRKRAGVCLLIDDSGVIVDRGMKLDAYLRRPVEPNWLYLDNRYIQYTNALCAAHELRGCGKELRDAPPLDSLPVKFRAMVTNELTPAELVPDDLYTLKQRAQAGPHHEFPLRSDIEPNFQVLGPFGKLLGTLTYGQVLREAYPGAVYYYMAHPYRVIAFRYRQQEIIAKREKCLTTHPLAQTMVFPRFPGGVLSLRKGDEAFVAEAEVQVSERVLGFREQRGKTEEHHAYGPDSDYSQRELTRFFPTTGVCWFFPKKAWVSERIGRRILEAYCAAFGVQARDVGVGMFHANTSPLG